MKKRRGKRQKHDSKSKAKGKREPATGKQLNVAKRPEGQMQIAALVLGAMSVIGFVVTGAVYGHNRVEAIWFLFLPSAVILVVATCLQWHLLVLAPEDQSAPPTETVISGLLVPANEPTPANPCGTIPNNAMLVLLGNSASWSARFPQTIIKIGKDRMLTMDEIAGQIAISGKFYSRDGRIVATIENNEFSINPNNYFRKKRPDKHSLVVWDQEGAEVLNVRFINPKAIKFLGLIRHPMGNVEVSGTRGLFANTICSGEAGDAHFAFN
jgi:hypothetical protein